MSTIQYVRAGACVQGQSLSNQLANCALEFSDCPSGTTFWSAHQVADALGAPAATCLTAAATNQLLVARCGTSSSGAAVSTVGACLVEDFQAVDIYHCAVSKEGCASGDEYLNAGLTATRGDVTCYLCGLDSSMDADLSDVTDVTLLDRFRDASEDEKLEAVAIAGIVLGLVVGCGLLLILQRLCRSCCGGRKQKNGTSSMDKASSVHTDAMAEASESNNNGNNNQPAWTNTAEDEESKII